MSDAENAVDPPAVSSSLPQVKVEDHLEGEGSPKRAFSLRFPPSLRVHSSSGTSTMAEEPSLVGHTALIESTEELDSSAGSPQVRPSASCPSSASEKRISLRGLFSSVARGTLPRPSTASPREDDKHATDDAQRRTVEASDTPMDPDAPRPPSAISMKGFFRRSLLARVQERGPPRRIDSSPPTEERHVGRERLHNDDDDGPSTSPLSAVSFSASSSSAPSHLSLPFHRALRLGTGNSAPGVAHTTHSMRGEVALHDAARRTLPSPDARWMQWWWKQLTAVDTSGFFVSQPRFRDALGGDTHSDMSRVERVTLPQNEEEEADGILSADTIKNAFFTAAIFYARLVQVFSSWREQQEAEHFRCSSPSHSGSTKEEEDEDGERAQRIEVVYEESFRVQRVVSHQLLLFILAQWTSSSPGVHEKGHLRSPEASSPVLETQCAFLPFYIPALFAGQDDVLSSASSGVYMDHFLQEHHTKERIEEMVQCVHLLFPHGAEDEEEKKGRGQKETSSPLVHLLATMLQLYVVDRLWWQAQAINASLPSESTHHGARGGSSTTPFSSTASTVIGTIPSSVQEEDAVHLRRRGGEAERGPHRLSPFLLPVVEKEAPNYYTTISHPVCVAYLYEDVFRGHTAWRDASTVKPERKTKNDEENGCSSTGETVQEDDGRDKATPWDRKRVKVKGHSSSSSSSSSSSAGSTRTSFHSLRQSMEMVVANAIRFNSPASSLAHEAQQWKLQASKWCREASAMYEIILQLLDERRRGVRQGRATGAVGVHPAGPALAPPALWCLLGSLWGGTLARPMWSSSSFIPFPLRQSHDSASPEAVWEPSDILEDAAQTTGRTPLQGSPRPRLPAAVLLWIASSSLLSSTKEDNSLVAACRHPIEFSTLFHPAPSTSYVAPLAMLPSSSSRSSLPLPWRFSSGRNALRTSASASLVDGGGGVSPALPIPGSSKKNATAWRSYVMALFQDVQEQRKKEKVDRLFRRGRVTHDTERKKESSGDDTEEAYLQQHGKEEEEQLSLFWLKCDACDCWRILEKEVTPVPPFWTCGEGGRRCSYRGLKKRVQAFQKLEKKHRLTTTPHTRRERKNRRPSSPHASDAEEEDEKQRNSKDLAVDSLSLSRTAVARVPHHASPPFSRSLFGAPDEAEEALALDATGGRKKRRATRVTREHRRAKEESGREHATDEEKGTGEEPARRRRGRPPKYATTEPEKTTVLSVSERAVPLTRKRKGEDEGKKRGRKAKVDAQHGEYAAIARDRQKESRSSSSRSSGSRSSSEASSRASGSSDSSSSGDGSSSSFYKKRNGVKGNRQRKQSVKKIQKKKRLHNDKRKQKSSSKKKGGNKKKRGRNEEKKKNKQIDSDASSECSEGSYSSSSYSSSYSSSSSSSLSDVLEEKIQKWEKQVREWEAEVHPPVGELHFTSSSDVVQRMQKTLREMDHLEIEMEKASRGKEKK